MISVVILTLNEQVDLADCLSSVSWSDDVVVFDSYSMDRTVEIAAAAGARVLQRRFDNYAAQRNAALTEVNYKHQWVLMVDADERWPREVFEDMKSAIEADTQQKVSLYHFRRKDIFEERWLRRSTGYPTWAGRLVRLGHASVYRQVNEEYHTNGHKGFLQSHFIHYPFNKGISHWLERHNWYSSMEARALIEESRWPIRLKELFSRDPTIRRKVLKRIALRLPCRPILVFCYLYVFRLGFVDGLQGLTYCRLRAIYEYMIDLKVRELKRRRSKTPEPEDASIAHQPVLSS